MSNLATQQQNQSYNGLLQVPGGITSSLQQVQDGNGIGTGLFLSSSGANVTTSSTFIPSKNGISIPNTVSRLISDGFGDIVNVKDFGAIGNGIANDTIAIQNAINYASSITNGSVVYFPSGIYLSNKLIAKSNIIIDGGGSTLKVNSGQNYQIQLDSAAKNIVIRNFIFDGTNLTTVGGDSGAESVVIYGSVSGVSGIGYFNITITENRFKNIPVQSNDPVFYQRYHAILMTSTSGSFVSNNYIDQCGGDAINFNSSAGFVPPSSVIVSGNYIANGGDGGIAFNNGARGIISSNYIYKCDLGVGCGPVGAVGSTDNQSIIVSNNTFDSCQYGINFGYFIAGGIGPTNWVINSNTFTSCKQGALTYNGHTALWEANGIFSNNVIENTGSSNYDGSVSSIAIDINLTNCGTTIVHGNILKNNIATTSAGIQLVNCNKCLVNGNSIESKAISYDNSMIITNAFLTKIDNNILNGSVVGIFVNGSSLGNDIEITNNRLNDFSSYAINLTNASAGTTIKNNYLSTSTNPGTAINLSSSIQNVVCDNNTIILAAGGNAIVVNTSSTSVAYDVSFNTVYGSPILDGGTTINKRLIENW